MKYIDSVIKTLSLFLFGYTLLFIKEGNEIVTALWLFSLIIFFLSDVYQTNKINHKTGENDERRT